MTCFSLCIKLVDFFKVSPFAVPLLFFLGPAPEKITSAIFEETKRITEFCLVENIDVDLSKVGCTKYDIDQRTFEVEIVDSVADYVAFMKDIFDFPLLKSFLQSYKIVVNGMNGGGYSCLSDVFLDFLQFKQHLSDYSFVLTSFFSLHSTLIVNFLKAFFHIPVYYNHL